MDDNLARRLRAHLRKGGFKVESVAWVQRSEDTEFAAIVCMPEVPEQYERALEFLTNPECPFKVTRERHGFQDIRIFLAIADGAV